MYIYGYINDKRMSDKLSETTFMGILWKVIKNN